MSPVLPNPRNINAVLGAMGINSGRSEVSMGRLNSQPVITNRLMAFTKAMKRNALRSYVVRGSISLLISSTNYLIFHLFVGIFKTLIQVIEGLYNNRIEMGPAAFQDYFSGCRVGKSRFIHTLGSQGVIYICNRHNAR